MAFDVAETLGMALSALVLEVGEQAAQVPPQCCWKGGGNGLPGSGFFIVFGLGLITTPFLWWSKPIKAAAKQLQRETNTSPIGAYGAA